MARTCKCCICEEPIGESEEKTKIKNRYAHIRCFNVHMTTLTHEKEKELKQSSTDKKEKKKTPSPERKDIKQPLSEEEYKSKQGYYQKLRQLLDTEDIPTKIYAITEQIMKKYDSYTFEGMLQTLIYLELKEKTLQGDIVGIIPFYYEEAQKYFKELKTVEENNCNANVSTMYKEKVVVIKPKQRKIKQLPF